MGRPAGLNWKEGPNGFVVRPPQSKALWPALAAVAVAVSLGLSYATGPVHPYPAATLALIVAALALVTASQARKRTTVVFRDGKFSCAAHEEFGSRAFTHLVSDIAGFFAAAAPPPGHGKVITLVTRGGALLPLPIELDGYVVHLRGQYNVGWVDKVIGLAPESHTRFVVDRLNEALEEAHRSGTHYRVSTLEAAVREDVDESVPGREARAEESEDAFPIDASEARRRA